MSKTNKIREVFDPNTVPLLGSLAILALGDIGFKAWRKVKIENNLIEIDEKK
jgi:hypothetical protein